LELNFNPKHTHIENIIGIFLYLALWIYGMYNAYKTAEAYNQVMGIRST
jgi:hypothetical protein